MPHHARQRDANEKPIVEALQDIGASVTRLGETGAPDLLVGYRGVTYLIEVKQEHGKPGAGMKRTDSGLRDTQEKWWAVWRGASPVIVTAPNEALIAIGAIDVNGNDVA